MSATSGDAMLLSMGSAKGTVTAGCDAGVYALGLVSGSISAGRYAGLVTWGPAFPVTVEGPEGAFAWVYRNFQGIVHSTSGDAFLGCYGNAEGTLHAGGDALAWVVGDFLGEVHATGSAGAVALGNFNRLLTAGQDAFILAEGTVTGSLTAGASGDALLWAVGNVNAAVTAGHDAAAVGYGNVAIDLSAGRDVSSLWARGNLTGSVSAGRNVGYADYAYDYLPEEGPIFSFGSIDLTVHTDAGQIGDVAAWGSIAGEFHAATSIGDIRSGGAVTATLDAPSVGTVVANDRTVRAEHPYPQAPASIEDAVLAEAAAAYNDVCATKVQMATDIAGLLADYATAKTQTLADSKAAIDQAIHDVSAANAAAELKARESLIQTIADAQVARRTQAQAAADGLAAARKMALDDLTVLQGRLAAMTTDIPAILAAAQDARNVVQTALAARDKKVADAKTRALAGSEASRQIRETQWDAFVQAMEKKASDVAAGMGESGRAWYNLPGMVYDWVRDTIDTLSNADKRIDKIRAERARLTDAISRNLADPAAYRKVDALALGEAMRQGLAVTDVAMAATSLPGLVEGTLSLSKNVAEKAVNRAVGAFAREAEEIGMEAAAEAGSRASSAEARSIFKAPQPGMGEKLLNEGFLPEDFAAGDKAAYFAKERELADQFARSYGEGVLEVQVPKDVYDARLLQYEELYQGGPYTELAIPLEEFDVLNDAARILHL